MTGAASAIRLSAIEKHFGAVHANRGAALEVRDGEIHALVGENGAGKSTLMKILSGLLPPDGGTVEVAGRDVTGWTTAEAIAAGVGMVHQHFMLVPTLTVAENVVLGREPLSAGMFDRAAAERDVASLCEQSGLAVPANRLVADLSVGEAQRVEILKLLYRGARVLLLDEPTAVLSPPEVAELWKVLRRLRDGGATIVLITHKLDEVMAVSEHVTVMRHGETVANMATRDTSPEKIARAMVGRDVDLAVRGASGTPAAPGAAVLEVRRLVVRGARIERAVSDVTFAVAAGEILGIAGVEGNGQTELLEAIAGIRAVTSGTISLGGADMTRRSVHTRGEAGLSHIPEDRHRRGLVLDYSVADNLILGQQHHYATHGVLDRDAIVEHARHSIIEYDIRPADPSIPARALSGRQPTEDRHRAGAVALVQRAARGAADARRGRGCDRVHPRRTAEGARRRQGGAARFRRAEGSAHAVGPDRGDVRRKVRRDVRAERSVGGRDRALHDGRQAGARGVSAP